MEAVATYLGHSGFLVETGGEHGEHGEHGKNGEKLVFDYLGKGLDESRLTEAWVFISHAHRDHCSSAALSLIDRGLARGIVSFDVTRHGLWRSVRPGDRVEAGGIDVRVYGSTDEGVSFLVEAGGIRVFHAGDLNYWHWRAESTEAEVREAYEAFDRVLHSIEGERVDIAFFPVDPRMLEGYDEGAMMFAERVRPKVLIPMHFWEDKEAPRAFCRKEMPAGVRAVCLTRPGESFLWRDSEC